MTIYYLCVKTHKVTGLKYLCQTKQKDPHKYYGSGLYWKTHLNKYGKQIDTEIIKECVSVEELRHWGIYYSNLWNIVESDAWANLIPESGVSAILTADTYVKIAETKKKNGTENSSPAINDKRISTRKKNGTLNVNSDTSIQKTLDIKERRGTLPGSPETISKQLETKRVKGTMNTNTRFITCQYCNKTMASQHIGIWHGEKCRTKPKSIDPSDD